MRTALLDPPWPERGGGKIKRGADRHYPLLTNEYQMAQVIVDSGLWKPDVHRGCSVWMWATVNYKPMAMRLLKLLCATYVTKAVWIKARKVTMWEKTPKGLVAREVIVPQHSGLGQRMRIGHEDLLYARIGSVPLPPPERRMAAEIYAPRSDQHSQKPEEAFELIEKHDPPGRKVEFFSRSKRKGWTCWGNEV